MFCPTCGQENAAGARTCVTCGTDLSRVAVKQPDSQPERKPSTAARPDMENGGFWRRFVAFIIDYIILAPVVAVFSIPLIIAINEGTIEDSYSSVLLSLLAVYIVRPLYFIIMETSVKQATLGKMILGLIVTDEAGNRISFGKACGRNFTRIISEYFIYIGYIMIAFTKKKQGLHDMLAGTLVIKK